MTKKDRGKGTHSVQLFIRVQTNWKPLWFSSVTAGRLWNTILKCEVVLSFKVEHPEQLMSVAKHNVPSSQSVSPLCVAFASCFEVPSSTTWRCEPLRGREVHWHSRLSQLITSNAVGVTMSQSDASAYVTPRAVSTRKQRQAQTRYVAPRWSRTHVKPFLWITLREREECVKWPVEKGHTRRTDGHMSGIFRLHDSHFHRIKGLLPCTRNKTSFPRHFETWSITASNLFPASATTTPNTDLQKDTCAKRNPHTLHCDFRLRCFSVLTEGLNLLNPSGFFTYHKV